jgi:hypothetical protein
MLKSEQFRNKEKKRGSPQAFSSRGERTLNFWVAAMYIIICNNHGMLHISS